MRGLIQVLLASGMISACSASGSTPTVSVPTDSVSATPTGQVASDVVYAISLQENGDTWTLDIYAPSQSGNWPVVVFLHGFGAVKEGHIKESQAIAESGAIVYTLNWPTWIEDLAEKEQGRGFREMFEVAACGIRFARSTASDYGGDSGHVIVTGFSYGGYLGAWVSLGSEDIDVLWEEFAANEDGPPEQVNCERTDASIEVNAFIGVGGAYFVAEKFEERNQGLWEILSPIAHLGRQLNVSVRLLHGERDTTVPLGNSERFRDILREAGYDTQLIMYDGIHRVPSELTAEVVQQLAGGR